MKKNISSTYTPANILYEISQLHLPYKLTEYVLQIFFSSMSNWLYLLINFKLLFFIKKKLNKGVSFQSL